MQMWRVGGWGNKKARNPSADRKGAADLAQLMDTVRFPLSTIHGAAGASGSLGLLFCFLYGHCVPKGGKESLDVCLLHPGKVQRERDEAVV